MFTLDVKEINIYVDDEDDVLAPHPSGLIQRRVRKVTMLPHVIFMLQKFSNTPIIYLKDD